GAIRGSHYHLKKTILNFKQAKSWAEAPQRLAKNGRVDYDFSLSQWFRIPISSEGIYQISGSALSSAGVDISSVQVNTVQIFNDGGTPLSVNTAPPPQEDLSEIAISVDDKNGNGTLDSDDLIIFYGVGLAGWRYNSGFAQWEAYSHPYETSNYYLLTFNQNAGKRITVEESPNLTGATRATQFTDYYRFEQDVYNILESGLDWYWIKFEGTSASREINFNLPQNILSSDGNVSFNLQGGSGARYYEPTSGFNYIFEAAINNSVLASNIRFGQANSSSVSTQNINTSSLRGGENTLKLDYTGSVEGCFAFFDFIEVTVDRPFTAENGRLKFYYEIDDNPLEFLVTGLSGSANRVWDVSDFSNVKEINPLDASGARFHASSTVAEGRAYQVFAPTGITSISDIQPIESFANLRNPDRRARLLIITPGEFYETAQTLESFKESDFVNPIQTEVIRTEDIFTEFSSGLKDPAAIRNFIRYANMNWGTDTTDIPEYIMLFGDGSYDYRNLELANYSNRIPTFQVSANNDIASRAADNFYVAINNTNGVSSLQPELAIGRIPVNNLAEAENYISKLIKYDRSYAFTPESQNGWQSVLTFVADDECPANRACTEWFHLRQTEEIVNLLPEKFDVKKIYLTDYETETGGLGRLKPKATTDLLNQINRGTLFINFYGHGDPNTWAHEQVLTRGRDLPFINNDGRLPIWVAATCTWGQYDDPNTPSMAEAVIWNSGGGIASIAASRPTFAFANERFVENMFDDLFRDGSNTKRSITIGDAILPALDGTVNSQKYHLFGDPSLRVADPSHQVELTTISQDTLKALSKVTLQAEIKDSQGNPLNNFNGKALIRVFDAVDSTVSGGIDYALTGGTIFNGIVSVNNGRIGFEREAGFKVPKSIKYKDQRTGRISIYAWSENSRDAVGFVDTLLFNGSETQINDPNGPDIAFDFPDQPEFFDGDFVSQQSSISIRLEDESGINLTGEVGHLIELTIDGTIRKDVTEFFVYDENSFQKGELLYTLPAIGTGQHTLTISAWDNLNNYSEKTLNFTTSNAEEATLTQVVNYPNPLSEDTEFTFQYLSPSGTGDVSVKIYTIGGRQIQELNDLARPGFNKIYWDGRDRDGDVIANGVYLYKIVVDDGEKVVEKREKLVISR
ncbi:MAG: type IX secretion system sortase PorU, partial [Calditrichota bacterium]